MPTANGAYTTQQCMKELAKFELSLGDDVFVPLSGFQFSVDERLNARSKNMADDPRFARISSDPRFKANQRSS